MNMKHLVTSLFLASYLLSRLDAQQPSASPRQLEVQGDVQFVHDPAIVREGANWYLFSTGNGPERKGEIPIRCSQDLHQWKTCGTVFPRIPQWIKRESLETKELWAPDVLFFDGQYHLYYAFSVFGKNTSGIALLTNKTLDPSRRIFIGWIAAWSCSLARKTTSTPSIRT